MEDDRIKSTFCFIALFMLSYVVVHLFQMFFKTLGTFFISKSKTTVEDYMLFRNISPKVLSQLKFLSHKIKI